MYPLNDTEEEEQPSGQQCAGPLPRQPPAGADQHRHVQLQPPAEHPGPVHSWRRCPGQLDGDIRPEAILSTSFGSSRTAK